MAGRGVRPSATQGAPRQSKAATAWAWVRCCDSAWVDATCTGNHGASSCCTGVAITVSFVWQWLLWQSPCVHIIFWYIYICVCISELRFFSWDKNAMESNVLCLCFFQELVFCTACDSICYFYLSIIKQRGNVIYFLFSVIRAANFRAFSMHQPKTWDAWRMCHNVRLRSSNFRDVNLATAQYFHSCVFYDLFTSINKCTFVVFTIVLESDWKLDVNWCRYLYSIISPRIR